MTSLPYYPFQYHASSGVSSFLLSPGNLTDVFRAVLVAAAVCMATVAIKAPQSPLALFAWLHLQSVCEVFSSLSMSSAATAASLQTLLKLRERASDAMSGRATTDVSVRSSNSLNPLTRIGFGTGDEFSNLLGLRTELIQRLNQASQSTLSRSATPSFPVASDTLAASLPSRESQVRFSFVATDGLNLTTARSSVPGRLHREQSLSFFRADLAFQRSSFRLSSAFSRFLLAKGN